MNSLVVLLAVQILVSIMLILWVRLKVLRSLDEGDSIAKVRREIGALIVELDGSADRNITVIEDRLRALKDSIAEADKRIVLLSNEKARSWAMPALPVQPRTPQDQLPIAQAPAPIAQAPAPIAQAPAPAAQAPAPAAQTSGVVAPQASSILPPTGSTVLQAGQEILQPAMGPERVQPSPNGIQRTAVQSSGDSGNMPPSSVPFIRFSAKPLVFEEPFSERVARLHKRGFSSDIIAAKLKATIAEVDLAIAAGWNPSEGQGEG